MQQSISLTQACNIRIVAAISPNFFKGVAMTYKNEQKHKYITSQETSTIENNECSKYSKAIFKYLLFFILLIAVVLFIINKLVFILHVPSESMEPTMNVNEEFITKIVDSDDEITYGIYGFYSAEEDTMMVKRIVGLPGDVVEFVDGKMYRNNEAIDEDYVLYDSKFTEKFSVPDGHYLMLGDNRADSFDARYWANTYIPREDIVGKVVFRIHPLFRFGYVE